MGPNSSIPIGDNDALREQFSQAYASYADALYRHTYFRLSDRERAKDLVEEAFMRVWQELIRGEKIENIRAFLYRVLGNLIIDEYRKHTTVSLDTLAEGGFDPVSTDDVEITKEADARALLKLLSSLEGKSREIMVLRYVDDWSIKEIAVFIGESENVVSVRINRAIKQLKKLWHI